MPKRSTVTERRALLRAARQVLRERYREPELSLSDVAEAVGTSPRQLQRVFREEGGEDFRPALLGVRMRRAVGLLRRDVPSERVAHLVGYSGRSGLRLALRRYSGGKTATDFQSEGHPYLGDVEEPDEPPPLVL